MHVTRLVWALPEPVLLPGPEASGSTIAAAVRAQLWRASSELDAAHVPLIAAGADDQQQAGKGQQAERKAHALHIWGVNLSLAWAWMRVATARRQGGSSLRVAPTGECLV